MGRIGNYLFRRIGHHVGSLACQSVGAVERDQTIGNVIRELIAREFPDKPMTAGALAIIFLATVAGFLAIIAGGEI
jgi:hypothetical protein